MHGFKADGGDLVGTAQATMLRVGQLLNASPNRYTVMRNFHFQGTVVITDVHDARAKW